MASKFTSYANAVGGKKADHNQDEQYNNLNLRGGYTPDYPVSEWQTSTKNGKHNQKKSVQGTKSFVIGAKGSNEDFPEISKKKANSFAANKSILSLHIAAYEANAPDTFMPKNESVKSAKNGKIINNLSNFTSSMFIRNPFEFPRQQENDKNSKKPEISQFKASQTLLNPNSKEGNVGPVTRSKAAKAQQQQQQQQPQPHHYQQPQPRQQPHQQLQQQQQQQQQPFGWKCWRRLTQLRNANLLVVQVKPNGFIEMCIDNGRKTAKCINEECKRFPYNVKDYKIVDDPRLGHHNTCKLKKANVIREEQFCREFLLKIAATMVPPKWEEFENQFTSKFGAARFTQLYGTQEEQITFKNRINRANNSKVTTVKAEEIFQSLDDFNPDDEEDVEEIETTDAELNESLQNMAISDEDASSTTTTTTTSSSTSSPAETSTASSSSATTTTAASSAASSAETSAASSNSTTTTTTASSAASSSSTTTTTKTATISTKDGFDNALMELNNIIEDGLNGDCFKELKHGTRLGTGSFGTVYNAISKTGEEMALKVMLLNDEETVQSAIMEIKIMKEIKKISCSTLIKLIGASIVNEPYLRVSEENKNDENDGENEKAEANIPKLALLLTKGGEELENFMVKTKEELIAIVIQTTATMAMGEQMLELEHRDAHVSNILIEKTNEEEIEFTINGKKYAVKSMNVMIKMIDFGKSRLRNENDIIFCEDWKLEPDESKETKKHSELHYVIYDQMMEITGGNWKNYFPLTNVHWIRYLIEILTHFDTSSKASRYRGTQAFRNAKKKPIDSKIRKETAKEFFDAIENCITAGECFLNISNSKYFHSFFKSV